MKPQKPLGIAMNNKGRNTRKKPHHITKITMCGISDIGYSSCCLQ